MDKVIDQNKTRILLSAYSCDPFKASEAAVGWQVAIEMGRYCDVWAVVRAKYKDRILSADGAERVCWVFYDLPQWVVRVKEKLGIVYPYYLLWQIGSRKTMYRVARENDIQLVHHVTFGTALLPTLSKLRGYPFVWGPVGGLMAVPRAYWKLFSIKSRLKECVRVLQEAIARFGFIPLLKSSDTVLTVSPTSLRKLPLKLQDRGRVFSQVGLTESTWRELAPHEELASEQPFTVMMVGRMLAWKGFVLGIEAFSVWLRNNRSGRLKIVGDGPENGKIRSTVDRLGITGSVDFCGKLSRDEYYRAVRDSDVLLFPSLHEPGAFVIVEAMAAGKPVVCLSGGEPATEVTEETGICVELASPSETISELAKALGRLSGDLGRCKALGLAGRKRAESYIWSNRLKGLLPIYKDLLFRQDKGAQA